MVITRRGAWLRRGLAGIGLAAPLSLAPMLDITVARAADPVIDQGQMDSVVGVEDIQADAAMVSGKLVNRTNDTLLNVSVRVKDDFRWSAPRHQGADDPSQSGEAKIMGPVPPRAVVPFRYDRPSPLPARSDGSFKTDVIVLSVTRQPTAAAPPPTAPRQPYIPPAE